MRLFSLPLVALSCSHARMRLLHTALWAWERNPVFPYTRNISNYYYFWHYKGGVNCKIKLITQSRAKIQALKMFISGVQVSIQCPHAKYCNTMLYLFSPTPNKYCSFYSKNPGKKYIFHFILKYIKTESLNCNISKKWVFVLYLHAGLVSIRNCFQKH